jgi:2-phospho-L-lactate guanylyltransferase (CobY/MobA/RfbA family)
LKEGVSLLVFVGAGGQSEPERMVAEAQEAIALDNIEQALAGDWCREVIVSTGSRRLAKRLAELPVMVELDRQEFHFGRQLAELIARHRVERAFYVGGGSNPLLSPGEMAAIGRRLLAGDDVVVPNNLFSCDFVAFTPASAVTRFAPPAIDNNLAWLLHYEAGLACEPMARTPGTQLDVDTPTDLALLRLHGQTGPRAGACLQALDLDLSRLRAAMRCLTDRAAEITVAGRVGSHVWARLETDLACRKRVYSEERGMRASGREGRGEVNSLLGRYLEAVGPNQFFAALATSSQAILLDSRVIFHYLGLDLSPADRFWSDLLRPDKIVNPTARAFTAAARDAGVPVVLGGHSLVSGGLLVLIDCAWREHDAALARQA